MQTDADTFLQRRKMIGRFRIVMPMFSVQTIFFRFVRSKHVQHFSLLILKRLAI